MLSDVYALNSNNCNGNNLHPQNVPPNSVISNNNIKQEVFNRATIGQIQANSLMYQNGGPINPQTFNIDST